MKKKEKKKLEESRELNFLKWDNYGENSDGGLGLGKKGEDFETSIKVVKEYVQNRFNSLTTLINNAVSSANKP